jgi:4-hydroxybenzoate polyprenyltransferase
LAAGDISIFSGVMMLIGLIVSGLTISFFLSPNFFICVLVYMIITLTYSLVLKRLVMLDVISLASLYTIRVIAGTVLINVQMSFWLLAFSIFLFFSLALVKRCTELQVLNNNGKDAAKGRDYLYKDLPTLRSMGIAGGFLSVVVFSLYMNSSDVLSLYSKPQILWLICPILLYWISRMWILTGRDEMDDDPVVFAIKDGVSLVVLTLVALLVLVASYVK